MRRRNYNIAFWAKERNYSQQQLDSIHLNNFVQKYSGNRDWKTLLGSIDHKNTLITTDGREPFSLLASADLLITDTTSLGLYFTILRRPIIVFDNPKQEYEPFALLLELRKDAYLIRNVSEIKLDIEKAFNNFNPRKMESLSRKIFSYLGSSWKRYSHEIYESLSLAENNGKA